MADRSPYSLVLPGGLNGLSDMQEQARNLLEQAASLQEALKSHLDRGETEEAVSILTTMHPADQAQVLTQLDLRMQNLLMSSLTHETAGEILNQMDDDEAVALATEAAETTLALWLDKASTNVAAQILRNFPPEKARATLEAMSKAEAEAIIPLLEHENETAGGIMTPEFVAFREKATAAEAMSWMRRSRPDPKIMNYLFVVDVWNRLTGVVALSDLILAEPDIPLSELMDLQVISVEAGTDQEECARIMQRYDISRLPVIDRFGRLLGAIMLEDVMEVVEEEATEDMYYLAGLSEPERIMASVGSSVKNRLPWLVLNLATVILATAVIGLFESTIAKFVVVASFVPVVASQGGVGATQTLTIMVRGLALGDIDFSDIKRALLKEVALGATNGIVLGLVVGLVALAWKGSLTLGLALGIAMVGNMIMAGLSGVAIPLGLKLLRIDPAVASVVFVTTVTDVFGFLFFLGLVVLLLPVLS